MPNPLILQFQSELTRGNLQQIIHLCRALYDDDPLLYGLCYAIVLSLLDIWEDDEIIAIDRYAAIQNLQQPLLALLQTPRVDSALWIARLEMVFRAWKQARHIETGRQGI